MKVRLVHFFLFSAGVLLLLTAIAKFISSYGKTAVLEVSDPILVIKFRYVFILVGLIELTIALVCFFH